MTPHDPSDSFTPEYRGAYRIFDRTRIRPYPIAERANKTDLDSLVRPGSLPEGPADRRDDIREVAERVADAHRRGAPVVWMMGAHLVKLGLAPLVVDLIRRRVVTLLAVQGAVTIHDFEFAMIGATSEKVPDALPRGRFGLADETGRWMSAAYREGFRRGIGQGEALGRVILGDLLPDAPDFPYRDGSLLAACAAEGIPATVHATLGTDIVDQHPAADGAARGGTSYLDFLVFTAEIERMHEDPGTVLNVGSAVTLPEVLLKAVSMCANVGAPPQGIFTANLDLLDLPAHEEDDRKPFYYRRDNKSVVSRIPRAFGGRGIHVPGDFRETLPALHRLIIERT